MLMRSPVLTSLALAVLLNAPAAAAPPIGGGPNLAILRPCAAAQLKGRVTSNTGATLHRELRIELTNASTTACAIDGFPAVRLLDELGHPRITAESFSRTPKLFIIAPGQRAAFLLRVATGDGVTSFLTAPTLAVIPPGDVKPLLLKIALPVAPVIEVTAVLPAAAL